jgi:hypothetical protein
LGLFEKTREPAGSFAARSISRKGLGVGKENCRSLGFAPNEQKIKPIESISVSSVHFSLNLPQASQFLGMTKGRAALALAAVTGDGQSGRLSAPFSVAKGEKDTESSLLTQFL